MYDYSSIHTFTTEVGQLGGTTTSVLAAPGGEVMGIEAEALWLATDRLTVGGNFSFTPSEYTESFRVSDTSDSAIPGSLYPGFDTLTQDIKGKQLIQVPETLSSPDGRATMSLLMMAIPLSFSACIAGSMMSIIRRSKTKERWHHHTAALMHV